MPVRRTWSTAFALASCLLAGSAAAQQPPPVPLPAGANGWRDAALEGVRGITVGPIESVVHPDAGYGTAAGYAALREARAMGATWVALTPFGRVWDLKGSGVDLTFEAPVADNRQDVLLAIAHAHGLGLKVMLVPHLWVETGGWRALIDPGDEAAWQRWTQSYGRFLLYWTAVASEAGVEMLSLGVELRSWVTGRHAFRFAELADKVRAQYPGLLTYSANWDDLEHTAILGQLDVLGVNAFYPLADKENASFARLLEGGQRVADGLEKLARAWRTPILLTEMGYTTRRDPAVRTWEWPDHMTNVMIDQADQANAYRALLAPLVDKPWCAGFFAWRTYADPEDVSQEAEWGFSPRGKLAELVLRDTFGAQWAADGQWPWGAWVNAQRARTPGVYRWEMSPEPAYERAATTAPPR